MNDLSFLSPSTPSTTTTVSLPHGATARIRGGTIEWSQRGRYHYTELAAAKRAELRFRDRRAQSVYVNDLRAMALSDSNPIPVEHAEDVRVVRLALAEDRRRYCEIVQAVDALREQVAASSILQAA